MRYSSWENVWVAIVPRMNVWPSGSAFAARWPPSMPPAPPTFSITTFCPRIWPIRSAMIRPNTSIGPPAAAATTIVSGRLGHSCAVAEPNVIEAARTVVLATLQAL